MTNCFKWRRVAIVLSVVLGLTASNASIDAGSVGKARPWKGSGIGQGEFFEFIFDGPNVVGRLDVDSIVGHSTHLGRFTVTPELDQDGNPVSGHTLSFLDGSFVGWAHWRAANGDELYVTYSGVSFPNPDPDTKDAFPFAGVATFIADGGTGRFEDASGTMTMDVAFSFPDPVVAPIDYFFSFEGKLTY